MVEAFSNYIFLIIVLKTCTYVLNLIYTDILSTSKENTYLYTDIDWSLEGIGVWKGGPDPAFQLFFCENPASHFLFLSLSRISCQIFMNPASWERSNPESCTLFSQVLDPMNTLPDPDRLWGWKGKQLHCVQARNFSSRANWVPSRAIWGPYKFPYM